MVELNNGFPKRPDFFFRKLISHLLPDGQPHNRICACSLVTNCVKESSTQEEAFRIFNFSITSTHSSDCITKTMSKFIFV